MSGVEVTSYDGLTVDAARACGAKTILRGVRSVADFEYERNLADLNRAIAGIDTAIICADPALAAISSSAVRELKYYGHDISGFIP
jgi:pantetheine-phosphate adenylyltransferase